MELIDKLSELLDSGDPVVRQWFLIRNNYLPFILTFLYVILTRIGPYFMRNRKPFELRNVMVVFNFSLVCAYVTLIAIALYYLPKASWELFCYGGSLAEGEPAYILISVAYYGYLLKYIEYLDTLFFILRKKENLITFLHVFHHSFVPILAWLVFRTEKNGLQGMPGLLNGIVHIVMYSYYGLAAMGPSVRKYLWWKKYLTQMQLTQFILIFLFVTFFPAVSGCPMRTLSYVLDLFMAPMFFFLFYRYYRMAFKPLPQKVE